jgi:hypothetical protein
MPLQLFFSVSIEREEQQKKKQRKKEAKMKQMRQQLPLKGKK